MFTVKLMLFSLENDILLFITSYTVNIYLLLYIKKSSINLILEWSMSVDAKFKSRVYVCVVVLSRTDPWLWLAGGFSFAVSFFKTCRRVWELSRIWKRKNVNEMKKIYDLSHSTGQDLQLPRRKGHKSTSRSHTKVPHLTHPPFIHVRIGGWENIKHVPVLTWNK